MRRVIIVSGPHGAGKSTCARAIANALKLRYVSAGDLFREVAKQKGVDLTTLTKLAAADPTIDREIDEFVKVEARKGDVVIDAQLGAWMAGDLAAVKLFITAPDEIRFKRIADREKIPIQMAMKDTLEREAIQRERYQRFYGINVDRVDVYDLKLDTGSHSLEEMKSVVIEAVKAFLAERKNPSERN